MTIVICDSSILILISKLEILDLLIKAFKKVIIPSAVFKEAVEQGKLQKKMDAFLIERKIDDGKIGIENIKKVKEKKRIIRDFNLHDGESEAIVLYLEKNADLLGTDDKQTLKVCKIFGIKYFTTPLFLSRCYSNQMLSRQMSLLKFDKLLEFGWYKEDLIIYFKNKIKEESVD
ncbi:MAG: hypothetical protein ACOC44_17085 [Promethearchaeia archaeon]